MAFTFICYYSFTMCLPPIALRRDKEDRRQNETIKRSAIFLNIGDSILVITAGQKYSVLGFLCYSPKSTSGIFHSESEQQDAVGGNIRLFRDGGGQDRALG